jgi:hypothetical protein
LSDAAIKVTLITLELELNAFGIPLKKMMMRAMR